MHHSKSRSWVALQFSWLSNKFIHACVCGLLCAQLFLSDTTKFVFLLYIAMFFGNLNLPLIRLYLIDLLLYFSSFTCIFTIVIVPLYFLEASQSIMQTPWYMNMVIILVYHDISICIPQCNVLALAFHVYCGE